MLKTRASLLLLLLLLLGFGVGLLRLFHLRFQAGDIFPPYSTLRTDPLGAKAFFESLKSLRQISVTRNFKPLDKLESNPPGTIFLLGVDSESFQNFSQSEAETLEEQVRMGNRVVLCFLPRVTALSRSFFSPGMTNRASLRTNQPPANPLKQPIPIPKGPPSPLPQTVSLATRWEIDLAFQPVKFDENEKLQPLAVLRGSGYPDLPEKLSWHSGLFFQPQNSEWKVIYASAHPTNRAVVIEREMGRGSLVLASDSYHVSNESIQNDRQPRWLAWLCGLNSHLVFDEAHFGLMEQSGVSSLIKKYRLQPLMIGFLLLGLLFAWKNSTSLLPRQDSATSSPQVAGKDSFAGFVNLLRRAIPARDLIPACFSEWKKSNHGNTAFKYKIPEMLVVVEEEMSRGPMQRDPVKCYQRLKQMVIERKR